MQRAKRRTSRDPAQGPPATQKQQACRNLRKLNEIPPSRLVLAKQSTGLSNKENDAVGADKENDAVGVEKENDAVGDDVKTKTKQTKQTKQWHQKQGTKKPPT